MVELLNSRWASWKRFFRVKSSWWQGFIPLLPRWLPRLSLLPLVLAVRNVDTKALRAVLLATPAK
jgi:hypothetical protein